MFEHVTNTTPTLSLSEFRLSQAVLEARYLNGFLHWDRAGAIWMEITQRYPNLKVVKSEPVQTVFRLDDKYEFSVQIDRMSVQAHDPHPSLMEFTEVVDRFGATIMRFLELEEYARIGFRLIYLKEFADKASASEALLSTGRLSLPSSPSFGVSGDPLFPAFSCRWEGPAKGVLVQMRTEERTYEFEVPFAWEGVKSDGKGRYFCVFDLDYFTTATVGIEQVRLSDWVHQAIHAVRRDSDKFLRPS